MGKRALVVDDSKSSRMFLAKLLAEQAVEVDAAETAEAAIDYLARSKPDVIFMDHLMPGMDGFQAMQAIKNNPLTAQIPILMYTSQEGELYLGQARALGAAGVVSKGAGCADVQAVLRDLWPSSMSESDIVVMQPAEPAAPGASAASAAPIVPVAELHHLREEFAQLRQEFTAALDAQSSRESEAIRTLLREAHAAAEAPLAQTPDKPRHSPIPWLLAMAAGIAAAVFGTLQWQNGEQLRLLRAELADSRAAVALLTARLTLPPEVEEPAAAAEPVDGAVPASALAASVVATATAAPLTVPAAPHIPE
jgi:CheY-like chemotaxis protein